MDELLLFTAVGFAAQLVDGALGMAYGITATTMLLSVGVAPAVASASVHAAETVTTGLWGRAHWRFGNVDRDLFWRIALPGMIGGVCGPICSRRCRESRFCHSSACTCWRWASSFCGRPSARGSPTGASRARCACSASREGSSMRSAAAAGGRSSRPPWSATKPRRASPSARSTRPIGLELWPIIAGLILGGACAALFAAYATQRLPDRPLMILVAVVAILLSAGNLLQVLL